jgi:hypothetical protein
VNAGRQFLDDGLDAIQLILRNVKWHGS